MQVLNHPDSSIRKSAAEAIGEIGSPKALEALMQALNDPSYSVRESAAEAIEKIGSPQPLSQLWEFSRSGNQQAFYAISKIQKRCRFYNYEIDQTPLPNHLKLDRTTSIIITGGNFGDFVAGNKDVKVRGDYIENQDNTIDSST